MNLAKVVAIHPESNMVDLLVLDDNRRLAGVRVMSPEASSSSGMAGLVVPSSQNAPDPYAVAFDGARDTVACVGYYRGTPVVMGFLFPTVTQCLFVDLDRHLHRTASDFYHTVDGNGNAEWFHPSGAYIRVGTSPAHEDLTAKDFNKSWVIKRNTDKPVHIHIEQAGGVSSIDIAPDGAIAIKTVSTALLDAAAGVTVKAPTVLVDSSDSHFTGKVTIDGLLTYSGGMAGSGGGVAAAISGDVMANGISLISHTHGGVKAGGDSSSGPK